MLKITFRYAEVKREDGRGTPFADFYSPIRAILGVRDNLSDKSVTRARTQVEKQQRGIIVIDTKKFDIGLGLQLSRTSYEILSLLVGKPDWCGDSDIPMIKDLDEVSTIVYNNSCTLSDTLNAIKLGQDTQK